MKTIQIKDIKNKEDLFKLTVELFDLIALTYSLREAKPEFISHFANVLVKYYEFVTFEQMELAFEYNAIGSLNDYLPKSGYSIDSKVKFTIQDLTKIVKAYLELKSPKVTAIERLEKSDAEIKAIHNEWISQLNGIFGEYMHESKRTHISIPIYTCDFLSKYGLIDSESIDRKESKIKTTFGRKHKIEKSVNEDLIYKCFDELISKNQTLDKFI